MIDPAADGAGPDARGFDLGSAISSRICHDLISPVGAIGNGVELLRELGGGGGPELALIEQSAETAAATLAFYRIAFGAARADDLLSLEAVRRTALRWFAVQRAALDWPAAEGETSRPGARLICNLLHAASSALPRGGAVRLATRPETGARLRIDATGTGAVAPDNAAAWLADDAGAPAPGPRDVHWLVAGRHATMCGAAITLETADGRVTILARLAPENGGDGN